MQVPHLRKYVGSAIGNGDYGGFQDAHRSILRTHSFLRDTCNAFYTRISAPVSARVKVLYHHRLNLEGLEAALSGFADEMAASSVFPDTHDWLMRELCRTEAPSFCRPEDEEAVLHASIVAWLSWTHFLDKPKHRKTFCAGVEGWCESVEMEDHVGDVIANAVKYLPAAIMAMTGQHYSVTHCAPQWDKHSLKSMGGLERFLSPSLPPRLSWRR